MSHDQFRRPISKREEAWRASNTERMLALEKARAEGKPMPRKRKVWRRRVW